MMSIHSIMCNNDNQDIVSMGTNSALITKKVIDNAFQVLSINLLACIKSFEILNIENDACISTKKIITNVKGLVGSHSLEDEVLYDKLNNIVNYLMKSSHE